MSEQRIATPQTDELATTFLPKLPNGEPDYTAGLKAWQELSTHLEAQLATVTAERDEARLECEDVIPRLQIFVQNLCPKMWEENRDKTSAVSWRCLVHNAISTVRRERDDARGIQGHPTPCTYGPLCPYCEIESLTRQRDEYKDRLDALQDVVAAWENEDSTMEVVSTEELADLRRQRDEALRERDAERNVPLCADHAQTWLTARHFKPGDCWFCQQDVVISTLKEEKQHHINLQLEAEAECVSLKAEKEEALSRLSEFGAVAINVVPGDHGQGEEVPSTPESLRAYIAELQGEWDGAERRAAAFRDKLSAALALVEKKDEALRLQHAWHLDQTERTPVYFGDTIGQVNADEYADSELCEKTIAALTPATEQDGKEQG